MTSCVLSTEGGQLRVQCNWILKYLTFGFRVLITFIVYVRASKSFLNTSRLLFTIICRTSRVFLILCYDFQPPIPMPCLAGSTVSFMVHAAHQCATSNILIKSYPTSNCPKGCEPFRSEYRAESTKAVNKIVTGEPHMFPPHLLPDFEEGVRGSPHWSAGVENWGVHLCQVELRLSRIGGARRWLNWEGWGWRDVGAGKKYEGNTSSHNKRFLIIPFL